MSHRSFIRTDKKNKVGSTQKEKQEKSSFYGFAIACDFGAILRLQFHHQYANNIRQNDEVDLKNGKR